MCYQRAKNVDGRDAGEETYKWTVSRREGRGRKVFFPPWVYDSNTAKNSYGSKSKISVGLSALSPFLCHPISLYHPRFLNRSPRQLFDDLLGSEVRKTR